MSNHRQPRPRSGEFSAPNLKQVQQDTRADSSEHPPAHSARSPARSYSAPYSQRSPAALIVDSGSSSRGVNVPPGDHEAHLQRHQHQQHRRVVSLSWPGEPAALLDRDSDWDQQLQDMSRRISSSSNSSGGSKAPLADGDPAPAIVDAKVIVNAEATTEAAAPNKRQRQMAFSKKRVSSGPIDIPPSPSATASAAASGGRGFHGDVDSGARGARAATDAGDWYPCWSATRPDDRKCGEGGGPPEHILIWERAVRSNSQLLHQAEGGGGSNRVSEGSRGEVVEEGDSSSEGEEDKLELPRRSSERRMSSDQGSGGVMLFEMDM